MATAARQHARTRRRGFAAAYRRDVPMLLHWTFPDSREAVARAAAWSESPRVTKLLCRRLWRDLSTARALPLFYRRRGARIEALRDLYSAECRLYANQRSRANAQAAMNDFLKGLAAE